MLARFELTYTRYHMKFSATHTHKITFFSGGWAPGENARVGSWIQADLGAKHVLYSITTQGRQDYTQWVKTYRISYSVDGVTWNDISTTFQGNVDQNTKVTNQLPVNTVGRYVRLYPITWNNYPTLRWEVSGCK